MSRPDVTDWNGADGNGVAGEPKAQRLPVQCENIPVQREHAELGAAGFGGVDSVRRSTDLAERADKHGRNEWRWFYGAIVLAAAVIVAVHIALNCVPGIPFAGLALSLCATTTGLAMMWRRGRLGAENPVAATLLTVALRTLVMMGALLFVAATKWTYLNSFATSLLGCYFLFLVLESVLSVRWYSSLTRVVES